MKKQKVIILGAGITGLTCAYQLLKSNKFDVTIIEKNKYIGGLASTFEHEGFKLDLGPHKLYTQIPYVQSFLEDILAADLFRKKKISGIYFNDFLYSYPPSLVELIKGIGLIKCARALSSFILYRTKGAFSPKQAINFGDYMKTCFGPYLYEIFFKEQCEKLWGKPDELSPDLAATRFAIADLSVFYKLLLGKGSKASDAKYFYYPRGGIGNLSRRLADEIQLLGGRIFTDSEITQISTQKNKLNKIKWNNSGMENNEIIDYLVSTIPINSLSTFINPNIISEELAGQLNYRHLILCYIFYKETSMLGENKWIFVPEKKYVFGRLSEQRSFDEEMVPKGKTVLCADIRCDSSDEIWELEDDKIVAIVLNDLAKMSLDHQPYTSLVVKIPRVYPLYTINYKTVLRRILVQLSKTQNLYTAGRQGLYNYNNMDHCIDLGINTANALIEGMPSVEFLEKTKSIIERYKIVD